MPNHSAQTFILLTVMLDSIGIGLIFPVLPNPKPTTINKPDSRYE